MFKKLAVSAVAVVLLAASAVSAQEYECGAVGSNLTCIKEDGTLTVSGTGAMKDYPDMSGMGGPGGGLWGLDVNKVVIENGVTHIGTYAFFGHTMLEVTVLAETPPTVSEVAFNDLNMSSAILHVPQGSIDLYRAADVWKDFGFLNPSTVTFDLQGGSGDIDSQFLTYGGKATKPADPTKGDINFAGWYKEASGTTPWNFETDSVTQDITLFAKWEPTSSIASRDRNINSRPSQDAAVIAPVSVTAFEFAAGPNPVRKTDGLVNIFITGKRVDSGVLTVYDAAGNAVSKIAIRDDAVLGNVGRRVVGSWNLRDDKGRAVSEGTYLLRGTLKTVDGKRERVSVIIGVR